MKEEKKEEILYIFIKDGKYLRVKNDDSEIFFSESGKAHEDDSILLVLAGEEEEIEEKKKEMNEEDTNTVIIELLKNCLEMDLVDVTTDQNIKGLDLLNPSEVFAIPPKKVNITKNIDLAPDEKLDGLERLEAVELLF